MRDLQLRFLDVFLREWALYRMKDADEPVESGDNAILEVPFDAEVHSGEIRVFADGERPLTGLALLKQGEDGWLVVPVSEFTVPATEQEILVGSRVYQLWNAFTASPDFASRSWIAETLPAEDIRLLAAAMAGVLAGEAPPDEFAELVGCPIVATDDPRLDYEREFARQPTKIAMRLVAPVSKTASGWFTWNRSLMGVAASFAILLGTVVTIMREPPQPSLEARKRLAEVAAIPAPPAPAVREPIPEPPAPAPVAVSEPVVEPPPPLVERSQAAADAAVVVSKCAAEPIEERSKALRERLAARRASERKSAERAREMQSRSRMDHYAERSKKMRSRSMSDALCCDADDFDDDGGSEVGVQQAYDNKKKMSRSFDGGEIGTSSYELVHRFLTRYRRLPPREMVRLDEVVNHFRFECSGSTGDMPVTVSCELAACPWNRERMLLCVGVQAKKAAVQDVEILFSFNEARVRSHRLLGYGYGKLTVTDRWPVGKIGKGDTRVSLHELVLSDDGVSDAAELLTVGLNYRDSETAPFESRKVAVQAAAITRKNGPSDDFRFAATVAEFAEVLGGSSNRDGDAYKALIRRVRRAKDEDGTGRWDELAELVKSAAKAADSIRHNESATTSESDADF